MKTKLLVSMLAVFLLSPVLKLSAQDFKANDVVGVWLNEDKDAQVDIYQDGDKFFGKIVWLKTPIDSLTNKPKLDTKNIDESLRTRPVMGMLLLKDFVFDGDDEWEDGEIYDPKSGKTYSCYMEFPDEDNMNNLKIRGYIGISLLGRTTYWTRVK
ncbi:MAG: DUF2147 domain-containing protein [Bacteroidetes bacterium]|nr:MAG: DUF2147 domain-containing protein [Bacteroidota bacterium]